VLAKKSNILSDKLLLVTENIGTPLKTDRNVSSSKDFKSWPVDFPNKIEEALIAINKSFEP
jgi:hypothetical protein